MDQLLHDLTDPNHMVGHFNYFLLIVSMLQRRMFRLRIFAIASGVVEVMYRSFFVVDPVAVLWEAAFVLVNIVQLVILWRDEYRQRFAGDEAHFVASMPPGIEKQALRRLLALSEKRSYQPGNALMTEGAEVREVLFITEGIAQVEVGGRLIALCRPGDYLGEMSFLTGAPASATVTPVAPLRALAFDQARLRNAIERDAEVRRAVEAGLNRNLVGKLARANSQRTDDAASGALA